MMFYKESEYTNEKALKKNPRNLYRYSQQNDWIFTYTWCNGTFMGRTKIRNGEFVNPGTNITVED
jgi:hypothetical protein